MPNRPPIPYRRLVVFSCLILVLLTLAGGGGLIAYSVLFPPPTTVSMDPKDGQAEVGAQQPIKLTFTRPVLPHAVEAALRIVPNVDGTMTSADRQHFSWTPLGRWADLTVYAVTLLPLKDAAGRAIKARVWRFTTTIVPRVVSLTTESGVTTTDGGEVPLDSKLKIAFNTPMSQPTVNVTLNTSPATLNWSTDGMTASFATTGTPAGAVDVALAPGAHDLKQHRVVDDWRLQLTLVFTVTEHTVELASPAIVQIPNDNYGARDQSGLQAASQIFEYVTEGGITRLSAVFTEVPDIVGPIRSGRLISFKITRHYHGINYFSGLSAGSFAALNADPVPTLFDTQGVYFRSNNRFAPNNLYIKGDQLKAYQDGTGRAYTLPTGSTQPLTEADALSVSVAEHNSSYAYDVATGTYSKTEDGHVMADALLNQPIHIELLVVMHTRETITNIIEDVGGGHGRDFDMESGGTAEFYFKGKMAAGRWSAPDRSSPLVLQLNSGQHLTLPKNLVWVDVVS